KIVDAPNDSALRVTPGTEVFDMEVADREHVRPLRGVTALLAPDLRPTIKGASKEFEGILPHPLVLAMHVFTDERGLCVEPRFVALGRAPDVHDGPASAGVRIHFSNPPGSSPNPSQSSRTSAPLLKSPIRAGHRRR